MFIPGCYCCTPPSDPCTLSGCTWSATEGTDAELTGDEAYNSPLGGATPDGTYEVSSFQNPRLGNNLPCRQIWIDTVAGFSPTVNENVYAINWIDGATHNPATQCPLTSVSFCVESKRGSDSDDGLTDGVVFVVRQGGKIYATVSQSVGVNWKRAYGTYTSSDFTWINGSSNPDFTKTGGTIEFGFALRLTVFANEEPFDSVLFDNLCVTLNKACVQLCNTSNCDVLNTGSQSLTVIGTWSAAVPPYTITCTTSSSVGNPAGSHKFRFSRATKTAYSAICVATSPVSLPANCTEIAGVSICCEIQGEGDSTYFGLTGYAVLGIHQNGYTYFDPAPFQSATPVYAKIGEWRLVSTGLSRARTSWYRLPDNAVNTGSVVSSGPDFSQSFDVGVLVGSGGGLMVNEGIVYVDNICLKVSYGCGCVSSYTAVLQFSGLQYNPTGASGCPTSAVTSVATQINNMLSSQIVLTKYGTCQWRYSQTFTSGSLSVSIEIVVSTTAQDSGSYGVSVTFHRGGVCHKLNFTGTSGSSICCSGGSVVAGYVNTTLQQNYQYCNCFSATTSGSSATVTFS